MWKFSRKCYKCANHLNYYTAVSSDKWCMQIHARRSKHCIIMHRFNIITSSGNQNVQLRLTPRPSVNELLSAEGILTLFSTHEFWSNDFWSTESKGTPLNVWSPQTNYLCYKKSYPPNGTLISLVASKNIESLRKDSKILEVRDMFPWYTQTISNKGRNKYTLDP